MSKVSAKPAWPIVFLFGDSLTQYGFSNGQWGAMLADHLQRKCDVLNRGFSGYNTRWCKLVLPQILDETQADDVASVTIFLGANDSNTEENVQHVPLEDYEEDLMEMVEYLQSIGIEREKIVLITPPACDVVAWAEDCKAKEKAMTKCNKLAGEYAKACVEAANECGTKCVDLYSAMMKVEGWQSMLSDGLHLSPKGAQLLYELLQPIIDKLTSGVAMNFPYWADVNSEEPEVSLT